MKKTIIIGLLLIGFTFQSYAQDKILYEAKVKKEEVPVAIIESLDEEFPGFVVEEYTAVPLEFIEDNVIIDRNIKSNNDYETYQVTLSNKKEKSIATYTKEGKLISTIANAKNIALPISVREAVAKAFPNWIFVEDTYKMVSYANGKKIERYKIIIKKGDKMKRVLVDASGNIISAQKKVLL